MNAIIWLVALNAVILSVTAIENKKTAFHKSIKELGEEIRDRRNLEYSLNLPHSHVASFRSLERRISTGPHEPAPRSYGLYQGRPTYGTVRRSRPTVPAPPYAVQMEPMVQYSQKDPLYDANGENLEEGITRNEIQAQPKILTVKLGDQYSDVSENVYASAFGGNLPPPGPPYGPVLVPYYEHPEPIIEIIIKESNESLPAPPPIAAPLTAPRKKEPVQVFYVKYQQNPHGDGKDVIYDTPVPAITPATNEEDHHDHHEEYTTYAPEGLTLPPPPSTTLRAIIRPDSENYHSDSGVRITFGSEERGHGHGSSYSDSASPEGHEESAPHVAVAFPQQPSSKQQSSAPHPQFHKRQQVPPHDQQPFPTQNNQQSVKYQQTHHQHAQQRIQYHPSFPPQNYQQLPHSNSPNLPFRQTQPQFSRPPSPVFSGPPSGPSQGPSQGPPQGPPQSPPRSPLLGPLQSSQGPPHGPPHGPPQGPPHGPPQGPSHGPPQGPPRGPPNGPPRGPPPSSHGPPQGPPQIPSQGPPHNRPPPNFQQRPNLPPSGPPSQRGPFPTSPQRPFHQGPQPQQFQQFNEHEYLQQNYHTITTEQLEPHREQQLPSKPSQNFREPVRETIHAPIPLSQEEYNQRYYEQVQLLKQSEQKRNRQRPSPSFSSQNQSPPQSSSVRFEQQKPGPVSINQNQPPKHVPIPQSPNFVQNQQSNQPQFSIQPSILRPLPPLPIQPSQFQKHPPPQQPTQHHQQPHQPQQPQQPPQHHHQQQQQHHQQQHQQQQHQQQPQQQHQIHGGQFIPPGGELIASIPKYEQHLLFAPTPQGQFIQSTQQSQVIQSHSLPLPGPLHQQRPQQISSQQEVQNQIQQQFSLGSISSDPADDYLSAYEQNQKEILQLQAKLRKSEEEQKKLLAFSQKPSSSSQNQQSNSSPHVNIQNHQYFTLKNQQQSIEDDDDSQYLNIQGRTPHSKPYISHNTNRPPLISSSPKGIKISQSTTPRYVSSTSNSIEKQEETKKETTKKPIDFELPDEVPDDLRQQLISSGILDNAQISILDYDKVGDIPLESLPPDQLANFYGSGGGLQISGSAPVASVVNTKGENVHKKIEKKDLERELDQEDAESERSESVVDVYGKKKDVEMKVVHFDPNTAKGQRVAGKYVQDDATRLDPVALNDHKYNRYLPLKVSGAQFPLPDVPELKGRKVTSVVVLAPVDYEFAKAEKEGGRAERATSSKTKGVSFVAGDALKRLVKTPTIENYKKWLEKENNTSPDLQSVVLLVTGTKDGEEKDKEIFMYDVATQTVSRLSGELSTAFVEVAETNASSKDFDQLTVADSGIVESSVRVAEEPEAHQTHIQKPSPKDTKYNNHKPTYTEVEGKKQISADKKELKPKLVDPGVRISPESSQEVKVPEDKKSIKELSESVNVNDKPVNHVLISSGYSRMKMGRELNLEEE